MSDTHLPRIRVFLSSTMIDLSAERSAIAEALERLRVFDVLMAERFPAIDEPGERVCLEEAGSADALILLVGDRYGYVPVDSNPDRLSTTHLEYRRARAANRPVFAFIRESTTREPAVANFLEELGEFGKGALWRKWSTVPELVIDVQRALVNWLARRARSNKHHETQERIRQVAGAVAAVRVRLIDTASGNNPRYSIWRKACIAALQALARNQVLPLDLEEETGRNSGDELISITAAPKGRASIHCEITPPNVQDVASPPIVIVVPANERGALTVAHVVGVLGLCHADDIPQGVSLCLSLLDNADFAKEAQVQLLVYIAGASALDDGSNASDIAQLVIRKQLYEEPIVSTVTMALMRERQRYERAAAYRAVERSRSYAVQLLTGAMGDGRLEPDKLYNLARHFIDTSHITRLYALLLETYPEYEARWYLHRDIGLAFYHAGDFRAAADAYQQAAMLKGNDAELYRWTGDALFYAGQWARSHPVFLRAVSIDDTERYFASDKIAFAEERIRFAVYEEKHSRVRRWISHAITAASEHGDGFAVKVPSTLLRLALRIWPINMPAARDLALRANRVGNYAAAVIFLRRQLAAVPENASARLNLVANLVFLAGGTLTNDARDQLRIAAFHGGPQTEEQFVTRLINTEGTESTLLELPAVLASAKAAFETHRDRRAAARAPEYFGTTLHVEME